MSWFVLHPKVKAALFATLAVVIADVAAQISGHVPSSPIVGILALFIPVIVAWAKSEEAASGGTN